MGRASADPSARGQRHRSAGRPSSRASAEAVPAGNQEREDQDLYRAHLLKEHPRAVFHQGSPAAVIGLLDAWIGWARSSALSSFEGLAVTIADDRTAIVATLTQGLSNARWKRPTPPSPDHPARLRLSQRRRAHRPGHALPQGFCPPLPARLRHIDPRKRQERPFWHVKLPRSVPH
jgi:hypothetical protein